MKKIRLIDRGGFGVVHEIELGDGTRAAKKSFDPQVSTGVDLQKLERRFAREVRVQSQIRHPNIMPVLDSNLADSPPWFTMPLAEKSFETKIAADKAAATFDHEPWQDILAAVEELHRLGYVHRDLKPENILLVDGTWVLSDFGLVLPMARETTVLTGSASAYGSLSYAAPEQAQDFRNTPEQADIFALGCILHDAVANPPHRIPFAQIRMVGEYGPVLEKCTEVQPERRFPTVAELRASLFELWRTRQFAAPSADDESLLDAVVATPDSRDAWRALIVRVEEASGNELLTAIDSELITALRYLDAVLFGRLIEQVCRWASHSAFPWAYCDVVGDRQLGAYRVATVRNQCSIVLAALELAVTHNRWHVIKQAGEMLSQQASQGLIDRILIEIKLNDGIESQLRRIEKIVHWPRESWHETLTEFLDQGDEEEDDST